MSRPTRRRLISGTLFVVVAIFIAVIAASPPENSVDAESVDAESAGQNDAAGTDAATTVAETETAPKFGTTINPRKSSIEVDTGLKDMHGKVVTVACSTCHATRAPNRENRSTADLDEFHTGLQMAHGQLACLACHSSENYDSLSLAEGKLLDFSQSMQLCAQCHGPQFRDYSHGSHGGMNGYWDLNRGPRTRNHCIDCHDPHSPKYQLVMPVFTPKDRFKPVKAHH